MIDFIKSRIYFLNTEHYIETDHFGLSTCEFLKIKANLWNKTLQGSEFLLLEPLKD
jgi:hypothetical protein